MPNEVFGNGCSFWENEKGQKVDCEGFATVRTLRILELFYLI